MVARKPYKQTDEVDVYYAGLATKIANIVAEGSGMDHESVKICGMLLAEWFEDIISNIGIWRTFNATCVKRYGTKVPFHDTTEYYDGEPNVCDIAFLLWHFMQLINPRSTFINPENPYLLATAEHLCTLLDKEYETAPENERLYDFVHQPDVEKDFGLMRDVVGWLALKSYIGEWNRRASIEDIQEVMEEDHDPQKEMQIAYQISINCLFDKRTNILAQPMTQWLADIRDTEESHKVLGAMKLLDPEEYLIWDVKDGYLKTTCLLNAKTFKIALESLNRDTVVNIAFNDTVFNCTLLSFRDLYYQVGIMKVESYREFRDITKQTNDEQRDKEYAIKNAYRKMMRESHGTGILFCANSDDAYKYVTKVLKLPPMEGTQRNEPVAVICDENSVQIAPHIPAFVKTPDNPYYDERKAKEKAHGVYASSTYCNYFVARVLHENNLIPDAAINSLKGEEYGRMFVHKHGRYLIDYFYQENHCALDD